MKLKAKKDSWWCRLVGKIHPAFMTSFWTTVGETVYYPTSAELVEPKDYAHILEHEKVHIQQYKKLGVPLFLFLYLLVPLPMFFSYFRWRFEREGYLVEIGKFQEMDRDWIIDSVVETLWHGYFMPWPKPWMRKWFQKNA